MSVLLRIKHAFFLSVFLLGGYFIQAQNFFLGKTVCLHCLKPNIHSFHRTNSDCFRINDPHLPDEPLFDSLKNLLIQESEDSRNRNFICLTYSQIAKSYLGYYNRPDYYEKGKALCR